ncbi:uncharacterized protein LOC116405842 [Cucumis sativus]|uniref:uncharacterized protein LOC116405842 n=1 Tax=Cucumis sativus TaxID=3659 RepID=UPI0012F4FFE5|nr:uncharacterized protein LOC116405842 [Cucumis sativus]
MASFEALHGKCCRFSVCWGEVGESREMLCPKQVQTTNEAIQKIRARMLTTKSIQKSYANEQRRDLEFDVGDMVFVKVAPMKGVMRFEKKGNLSQRFVTHHLALPLSLSAVHDVYDVSMLRKCVTDPTHIVDYESLQMHENLSYEEHQLRFWQKKLSCFITGELINVLYQNHEVEKATWEREDNMRAHYPELYKD